MSSWVVRRFLPAGAHWHNGGPPPGPDAPTAEPSVPMPLPDLPMMEAPDRIDTARLQGRRIAPTDLEDFKRFYADPAVMKRLSPTGEPYAPEAAAALFERHLEHWADHGYGTWVFRDPGDGRFVGRAGLRGMELDDEPHVELFYGIASDLWGLGFATEIARAILGLAFGPLRVESLVAFALPTNEASLNVLRKCGFVEVGELTHAGLRHGLYRLDRP